MAENIQKAILLDEPAFDEQGAIQPVFTVRRRDGSTTNFDEDRIRIAIEEAFRADRRTPREEATDPFSAREVKQISAEVVQSIRQCCGHSEEIDIEKIQDIVEICLMQHGHYSVARRYIVYREEHAKKREQREDVRSSTASLQASPWAREHFLNACAHGWLPTEHCLQNDRALWHSGSLSSVEQSLIAQSLCFLSGIRELLAENVVLSLYKRVSNAEARRFLLRQGFEQAKHLHAIDYMFESLEIDRSLLPGTHDLKGAAKKYYDFLETCLAPLQADEESCATTDAARSLIHNLFGSYIVAGGIFSNGRTAMLLSLTKKAGLQGMESILASIADDDVAQLDFGVDLINAVKAEHPEAWTPLLQEEMLRRLEATIDCERAYARKCLSGLPSLLSSASLSEYAENFADRQLQKLEMPVRYGTKNPLPWIHKSEITQKDESGLSERQRASTQLW